MKVRVELESCHYQLIVYIERDSREEIFKSIEVIESTIVDLTGYEATKLVVSEVD